MKLRKKEYSQEVNTGSMADIAFLLLIFFLVATTLVQDKGLNQQLPPKKDEYQQHKPINERNLFKVNINSQQKVLVQGKIMNDLKMLKQEVKDFVLNKDQVPSLSESPRKAIVSIKANRGAKYARFIQVLDELKAGYYEIYAEKIGVDKQSILTLDHRNPELYQQYIQVKANYPMNISIAEPNL